MGLVCTIDYSQCLYGVVAYGNGLKTVRDYQVYFLGVRWNA